MYSLESFYGSKYTEFCVNSITCFTSWLDFCFQIVDINTYLQGKILLFSLFLQKRFNYFSYHSKYLSDVFCMCCLFSCTPSIHFMMSHFTIIIDSSGIKIAHYKMDGGSIC